MDYLSKKMLPRKSIIFMGVSSFVILLIITYKNTYENQKFLERNFEFLSQKFNCSLETINSMKLEQDDPCILKIIREKYLMEPSKAEYHLSNPENLNPSYGQSQKILDILKNMTNGFFIECGAFQGEDYSNTIFMERKLGWSGLLIEASPNNFEIIKRKNRKAWAAPACLSVIPRPHVVTFHEDGQTGKITEQEYKGNNQQNLARVQCFPLYSFLRALNKTSVDFFSLDVEGHELTVLKTIPWDKVDIKTIAVEYQHVKEGKEVLANYMIQQGYTIVGEVNEHRGMANDFIMTKL